MHSVESLSPIKQSFGKALDPKVHMMKLLAQSWIFSIKMHQSISYKLCSAVVHLSPKQSRD